MATKESRSERMKRLREGKRLSLLDVANEVGVQKAAVSKWENHKDGKPDVQLDAFFALADLYEIDPRELALGEPPPQVADSPQGDLELTPTEKTIGRIWGQLPRVAREYFAAAMQNAFRLMEEDHDIAALIYMEPDRKSKDRIEKSIEQYQRTNRNKRSKAK